jgi:hypothetical protein
MHVRASQRIAHILGAQHWDHEDFARINGVKATLISPGIGVFEKKEFKNMTASAPVLFARANVSKTMSNSSSLSKYSTLFTLKSLALTEPPLKRISCHRRLRAQLSSSGPPMDFDVAVETPSILVAYSTFRIKASSAILAKSLLGHPEHTVNVSHCTEVFS